MDVKGIIILFASKYFVEILLDSFSRPIVFFVIFSILDENELWFLILLDFIASKLNTTHAIALRHGSQFKL